MTATRVVDSPIGPLTLSATERGLSGLSFGLRDAVPNGRPADAASERWLDVAEAQLAEYFLGERTTFDIPVDVSGSEFRKRVWQAIAAIPHGATASYAETAAAAGSPGAYRATGAACGANPVAIVIPCHRVVGADRSLHGFGGGLAVKRWLLEHEGVRTRATKTLVG